MRLPSLIEYERLDMSSAGSMYDVMPALYPKPAMNVEYGTCYVFCLIG